MAEINNIYNIMNRLNKFEKKILNNNIIQIHLNNFKIELFKLFEVDLQSNIKKNNYIDTLNSYKIIIECHINLQYYKISELYDFNIIFNQMQFMLNLIMNKVIIYIKI
jgi:hypothetical protein